MVYTIEQLSEMVETLQKQVAKLTELYNSLPNTYAAKLTFNQLDTSREGEITNIGNQLLALTNRVASLEVKI